MTPAVFKAIELQLRFRAGLPLNMDKAEIDTLCEQLRHESRANLIKGIACFAATVPLLVLLLWFWP